jgi:hypothetical protein
LSSLSLRWPDRLLQHFPPKSKYRRSAAPTGFRFSRGSRWSDGCVNCSRDDKDDQPHCSNPGIACQPKAIACLSPAASPKP